MSRLDELKAEQRKVLEALGNKVLSEEQIKRGWKRYDELTAEIAAAVHLERKEAEKNPKEYEYPPEIKSTIDKTKAMLADVAERRRFNK